jgi:hypothetical protein
LLHTLIHPLFILWHSLPCFISSISYKHKGKTTLVTRGYWKCPILELRQFFTEYHKDTLIISRWGSLCDVKVVHLHLVPGLTIVWDCPHGCVKSSAEISVVITGVGLLEMVLSFSHIIRRNGCWRNLLRTEITIVLLLHTFVIGSHLDLVFSPTRLNGRTKLGLSPQLQTVLVTERERHSSLNDKTLSRGLLLCRRETGSVTMPSWKDAEL